MSERLNVQAKVALVTLSLCLSLVASAQAPTEPRELSLATRPWSGDFDAMVERRIIRVLVPYSRTLYFVRQGAGAWTDGGPGPRLRKLPQPKVREAARQASVDGVADPDDARPALPGVVEGSGDIAAGNLTATDERRKGVDFVAPGDRKPIRELIVTGPDSPPIATLDDLSGKTVHVRPASSYFQSVLALNQRLTAAGKAPVKVGSICRTRSRTKTCSRC